MAAFRVARNAAIRQLHPLCAGFTLTDRLKCRFGTSGSQEIPPRSAPFTTIFQMSEE